MNPAPPVTSVRIDAAPLLVPEPPRGPPAPAAPCPRRSFGDELPVLRRGRPGDREADPLGGLLEPSRRAAVPLVVEGIGRDLPFLAPDDLGPHRLLEQGGAARVGHLAPPL